MMTSSLRKAISWLSTSPTPAAPALLTTGAGGLSNAYQEPYAEVVNQSYAYIASTTATGANTAGAAILNVVNVSLPTAASLISQVTIPQSAILLSFDIVGNTLLAAGNTAGERNPGNPDFDFTGDLTLTTMNLATVTAPAVVSTISTGIQCNGTFDTSAFTLADPNGNYGVFAIVNKPPDTDNFGPASLMIVDARNTSSIAVYPFQTQFGLSGTLTTNNGTTNYLFVPTALGLSLYQLQL